MAVQGPEEVTYEAIAPRTWNVLIPMAGDGRRFADAGYTFPKPLIEVRGKPMIQVVVENLNLPANYIFVVRREHEYQYNVTDTLAQLSERVSVCYIENRRDGAACSALAARELLDDRPLLIANSDQWIDWDQDEFVMHTQFWDGLIPVFDSVHPKWSYVRVGDGRRVVEVAEKRAISRWATCGLYWWRRGSDFVKAADAMIEAGDRTNGEFYIAPTYNHYDGAVGIHEVNEMWGLGTPEDLEVFIRQGP
jgi:NDP-sugar pyrophosphorylase family protein